MAQLSDVNTTDIGDAIRLGCRTMGQVFNADDNDVPFFKSSVWPEAILAFNESFSEAHVPGRHLNALLNAEDAIGVTIPEDVIEKHARAALFAYSGPVALPLNRATVDGPLIRFLPHNVREGFHALYALTKYRQSAPAQELAEASIAAINQHWDADTGWNRAVLEEQLGLIVVEWDGPFISGLARAIGPLVKYHRATGSDAALDLAIRLKDKALIDGFREDGAYELARLGHHTHSVTCAMSGLAQLADLTNDRALLNRVGAFYRNGLGEIADDLGWSIENGVPEANPDRGEANNTGDILETALILGRWGDAGAYHHAERILRGHLLPSQLRDISFITEPENPTGDDGKRDVARRHQGAFGFPAPYGHHPLDYEIVRFNMDIVGGAVASLCEACREIHQLDEHGHRVNLLFDYEGEQIEIAAPYPDGELRLRTKSPGRVFVRLPPWVDRDALRLNGESVTVADNGYLEVDEAIAQAGASIEFPLPEEEISLRHRTRTIRTRLRGDQVVAMDNFGADLTFFPPL